MMSNLVSLARKRSRVAGALAAFSAWAIAPLPAPAAESGSGLTSPATNSAIRPAHGNAWWMKRHEAFLARAAQDRIDVLFLGDSITDFWRLRTGPRNGRAVWDRDFAPLHAANFGISGDRTQNVLWRLDHGEVDHIRPKVVVLLIGTNNTGLEHDKVTPRNTPAEAAEGVREIVRELRSKLPQSRILLLAIFPRGKSPENPQRAQIASINRNIARLADGHMIQFLDIGNKFLESDGTISRTVMADYLHPTERGYEIWAAAMKPILLRMLEGTPRSP